MFNKITNKIITVSLSSLFIINPIAVIAENNVTSEICVLESSQGFGYTGDTSGKRLNTKEEYTYLCTKTTTEKGECNNWKTEYQTLDLNYLEPAKIYYETEDYSGSIGAMLSITQAYDKINGLWSGWHGICQTGMDDDNFDWMSDPLVLGSYALQAYSAGSAGSATSAATETAKKEAVDTAKAYAICAARAGLDTAAMVMAYEDDGEPCDPVDEFCEQKSGEIDSEVFTLPEAKLNDLLSNNPDMLDYIKIVKGAGSGTVTVRIVNPGVVDTSKSMEEAKEAARKIKELMLKIRAAVMAIQLAICIYNVKYGDGATAGTGEENGEPLSKQNLAMMAINAINPMVGLAVSIAANVYSSMQPINTCSDEDDAREKGERHFATLKAKSLGQCHKIEKIETSGGFLGSNDRTKYRYCCYDDKVTRIMVEQAKAQLGKDWQHCTDISLRELQYLKFDACDGTALDNAVDGTKLDAYVSQNERFNAYQYQNKCIDTREYIDYFKEMFGGEDMLLDTSDIEKSLENFK